ncbi:MAG TPA: ATP-binding cassette domain-containing protein, partial [Stellaceae bacterium]|nr:ATP-binding cassette domain-containing protein [Stellaceae bacterium]
MTEIAIAKTLGSFSLDVKLEAPESGITALFGRSGMGKTSVINALAGLMRPDRGRIVVGGTTLFDSARGINLPPEKRRLGYVFQESRLFPHYSVRGNLLYGAKKDGTGPSFDAVVDLLGIKELLARRPAALSGGEKQRVAIGRALLASPRLLLMDE